MPKKILFLLAVSLCLLSLGCVNNNVSINETETINLSIANFDDFVLEPAFMTMKNYMAIYGDNISTDCIPNKRTYHCLFLYAVSNGKEELCNYFPESRIVEVCAKYGCRNETRYYRSECINQSRIFKQYLASSDKIGFCNRYFQFSFNSHNCVVYTAQIANDENLCLKTDAIYGCVIDVSCRFYAYESVAAYQCKQHACRFNNNTDDTGQGDCLASLKELYGQWLNESEI
jgi:hypothetical protein